MTPADFRRCPYRRVSYGTVGFVNTLSSPPPGGVADRPRLRGVIHHYSAYVAAVAGLALVIGAAILDGAVAALTCAIYAVTVVGLFTVSATYHRVPWKTARARIRMKRADHAMIFLFIAGTYTPFCALGLPSPASWWVLGIVWAGALGGSLLKILWPGAPPLAGRHALHPARLGHRRGGSRPRRPDRLPDHDPAGPRRRPVQRRRGGPLRGPLAKPVASDLRSS